MASLVALLCALALSPPTLTQFAGTWELDPAASDDLSSLAKVVGVPSFLAKLAPKRPVQELRVEKQTLIVSGSGPSGAHSERFSVDGSPTTGELLGAHFQVVSTFKGGVLESTGTIEIDAHPHAFRLRRSVSDNLMRLTIEVDEVTVKRVFAKKSLTTR